MAQPNDTILLTTRILVHVKHETISFHDWGLGLLPPKSMNSMTNLIFLSSLSTHLDDSPHFLYSPLLIFHVLLSLSPIISLLSNENCEEMMSDYHEYPILCNCERPTQLRTSWTSKNIAQHFLNQIIDFIPSKIKIKKRLFILIPHSPFQVTNTPLVQCVLRICITKEMLDLCS